MSFELVYGSHVQEYVPVIIGDNNPKPVPTPIGTITERGDDFAVVLHDASMDDREGTTLGETNETNPFRPVDPEGFWETLLRLLTGYRVSPQGKIIVPLDRGNGPVYWQWMVDIMGERNAYNMLNDGNGYFDTAALWDMMCSATGGSLVHITDSILQNGTWWDVIELLDVSVMPEKIGGIWHYNGKPVTFERTPHLFTVGCNRRATNYVSWLTQGGVNGVSRHGNGFEHWPVVANKTAALQRARLLHYPPLPAALHVYKDSLVVDGHLVERTGGVDIIADALCFSGANTYVRDMSTGWWFVADEMLIQAQEPYSASAWADYRCYVPREDMKTPWMGHRGYRQPIANWMRTT